ncbi:MAG TPA: NAD(P)-dependent oxidoreductase [Flavobacterium sp.]|nr:NAD(P)-dependent oxidoreductase [Flavobacterium sp.]
MKIAIIRERKSPPDRRVVFAPSALLLLKQRFPSVEIKVESSDVRFFTDDEYRSAGFEVTQDVSDCDIFIGVKEVPADALIPNKKYFFFSHTIKKQPHNQKMMQAIIDKEIDLYDHETVVDANFRRLIGFGRYAGIVGAYNGIRAFGLKYELFALPKAEVLEGKEALIERLRRITLPPIKIVLTGHGKVAMGAKEILEAMKIKEVTPAAFLEKTYTEPVFAQLDTLDYNRRVDGNEGSTIDFYKYPQQYTSDFGKFANAADIFMAGHYHAAESPAILTREMLKDPKCRIKIVADISCDVDGPIACTVRPSTIAEPLYGYLPFPHEEADFYHPGAIGVMAVDNLPCELPKDASEGFGEMFLEHVIPAFFNGDKDGILERAMITRGGRLTDRFRYLEGYIREKKFEIVP